MGKIKTFNKFNSDQSINENWKNWAVALGIASSSLFINDAKAQFNLKDKIEIVKSDLFSKLNKNPLLKELEKDGYIPLETELVDKSKKMFDDNINYLGETKSSSKASLMQHLSDRKINPRDGFFVYRIEGKKVRIKWIGYL